MLLKTKAAAKAARGAVCAVAKKTIAMLASAFTGRELLLVAGLGLLAYGLSLIWVPAAFVVPGGILVAVAVFGVR